ncbi:hypothetical protein MCOR02_005223 [Pyricularia oryzae]|nr:hypothetical protein MCOR02_005223 [Pyricularia oryzae]KAI6278018.1 hypothetical protein MCOR34_011305 [Pyricularia oryzae]KAI6443778.1 hypothetical protein MCOR17_011345 [Pyricularia oryzae]KAI6551207.1 hypothetical protein MCOR04_011102 [Pyricularia oryzae]KAI6615743.1 hypothetical protein MCOR14_011154 [Pyricularia oryzae]
MSFFTPINGSRAERASARLILRADAAERLALARALAASQTEFRLAETASAATNTFAAAGAAAGAADRAGPVVDASAGVTTQSRKRRREEEDEGEGEGHPRRSSRPSRPRRVRPDGLIPRQVTCFGCARAFLAGTATGHCADQPGARSRARGARPPRCWNCRGGHTCLPLPAGGPLERAAGELGHALFCSPRTSAKEVQLLRNVVTYHFRDWTESQAKELAALQARRTPAPKPVTRASGVPVVPQGAQVAPPSGA